VDYETVIGMEVHVELLTDSKVFCGCSTKFGEEPNTQVCPVCMGMPGVLPVINRKAVEYVAKVGLALNCEIAQFSKLDRKNYFYPDLPKNYQISQYDLPLTFNGWIDVPVDGEIKRIRICRAHLEEDTGKNIHPEGASFSQVDLNRCGVPLLEIVSEPDIRSPQEAHDYLVTLKSILEYLDVSDCNMEEGSLRAEANVSLRPPGSTEFGVKTEVKNVNSFKGVLRALEFEVERQRRTLESGGTVVQETRGWDDAKGVTVLMRTKEEAHDYRYFPEPDLVPVMIGSEWSEEIRASLPELPLARRKRMAGQYGIPDYDAGVLTASKAMADYFEECAALSIEAKAVSNWLMGDMQYLLKENDAEIAECKITPQALAEMLALIDDGTISGKIAKDVFAEMFRTGDPPAEIVKKKGLEQIADSDQLAAIVDKAIADSPKAVAEFKKGRERALGFIVGQVMKATRGKANPKMVNELLRERLSSE
jgi:aspartyl-tRNA(Asn)/glutamyl-tRNA(Gln) amidotransferase subunit B